VQILEKAQGSASEKAQGGVQILKRLKVHILKGSRGSAILKRLKGECRYRKGSRGSADPKKAQGGVHILKRLKGECK
jgi:hypothetical protein